MTTSDTLPPADPPPDEPLEGVIVGHAPGAGPDPGPSVDPEAPFGWMVDRKTGERRPRMRPAYRGPNAAPAATHTDGTPPSLEELRAQKRDGQSDVPPGKAKGSRARWGKGRAKSGDPEPEYPPFRAGPIAKGVNRLYYKAGKLLKVWDKPLGYAVISVTQKVDDEDVTVGEAWEEIARTHPRIRVALLKLISGNQWAQLFAAHLPILLAIAMKDGIRERVPFGGLLEAFLGDGEEQDGFQGDGDAGDLPEGLSGLLGGLDATTAAQMAGIAQGMMANITTHLPRNGMQAPRMPEPPTES